MYAFLTALHVIICFGLVVSVLLQSGKGGGLAGAFGGQGGGQAIFGGRGAATFLSKATTVFGALFLLTALILAVLPRGAEGPARSLIQERAEETQTTQPGAVPEAGSPAEELPGAGTLPGELSPAPAGGASDQESQQESQETEPVPAGGSSEGQKDKTDEG